MINKIVGTPILNLAIAKIFKVYPKFKKNVVDKKGTSMPICLLGSACSLGRVTYSAY